MNINISEQHLAVLKFKCEEFNANNRGGQAMSECDYASMILRDSLAVHAGAVRKTFAFLESPVFTGTVSTPASTTAGAGFRIVAGVAPTSPTNGDMWQDGTDLKIRIGGVTKTVTLT